MFRPARPTADRIYKKIGGYAYTSVGQSLLGSTGSSGIY
jgi:hypothetical protein